MQQQSNINMESQADPYNPINILLQTSNVKELLHQYGVDITVNDVNIYRTALVHKSYCTRKNENFLNGNTTCPFDCLPLQEESNERLEFLGDAVINLIVAKYLFQRYPDENEGFLTKLRTKLVNGTMLAQFCETLNLPRYVLISKQIEENNGRRNKKILEDCFEAFIGALFLDSGDADNFKNCETWFINLIEENIDFSELIASNNNYKDMLLKYMQHNFNFVPKFCEISSDNTNNGKVYVVCIKDKNDVVLSTGSGATKKSAENDAARAALQYYGQ